MWDEHRYLYYFLIDGVACTYYEILYKVLIDVKGIQYRPSLEQRSSYHSAAAKCLLLLRQI